MKNTTLTLAAIALICAFAGCTGAQQQTEQTSTAANALNAIQNMSVEDMLQKSAEYRQQIENAKAAYSTAQQVDEATNASGMIKDGVKNAVKEKVDTVKKQLKDEKNAWKETLTK